MYFSKIKKAWILKSSFVCKQEWKDGKKKKQPCSESNLKAHLTNLENKTGYIMAECLKQGINPALFVAIYRLETGVRTSDPFIKHNNPGGLMSSSGKPIHYNTIEDGINAMIETMHNFYYDRGLTDIVSFGKAYCVPSSPWITQIKAIYKEIKTDIGKILRKLCEQKGVNTIWY